MKFSRFCSILATAVVLSLLMTALPVIPVSAAPVVSVAVEKAGIGEKVTVEGAGFTPSVPPDNLHAYDIYFSSNQIDVGDDINYYNHYYELVKPYAYTDDTGSFSKIIEIPDMLTDSDDDVPVQGGTYYFYVTSEGQDEVKAYVEFTVIGISEMTPTEGPVGTEVELSGVGFDGNDEIRILYDGDLLDIGSGGGDRRFKGNGSFTSRVAIPESTAGVHTLTVEDEGDHSGQVQFTVEPGIVLSPSPASSGKEVTITGSGFGDDADIFVYFDGDVVYITGDYDTNNCGGFVAKFIVPEIEPGSYLVEVEDDIFNIASATLNVGPGLEIEPVTSASAPGSVGDTVTVSGNGFMSNHEITITYQALTPSTFTPTSQADGSLSYSFTIPASKAGEHTIRATDGVSTKEVTFYMESTAPPAPALVLPETDTKASSKTEFQWEGVTDDSLPVTYELQVATNNQFTADSIVVNKIVLTGLTYTLSDEEELESTGEDAPYYWRVRAKDGASNFSTWTNGSAFTVGNGFKWPGWLTYTLIGIGAVLIFFLGLWLGRRSAVSDDYYY